MLRLDPPELTYAKKYLSEIRRKLFTNSVYYIICSDKEELLFYLRELTKFVTTLVSDQYGSFELESHIIATYTKSDSFLLTFFGKTGSVFIDVNETLPLNSKDDSELIKSLKFNSISATHKDEKNYLWRYCKYSLRWECYLNNEWNNLDLEDFVVLTPLYPRTDSENVL